MTLLVATNNPGKRREYARILTAALPHLSLITLEEAGILTDVEETGASFAANARLKAEAYGRLSGLPVLADDSGLEVDALGGLPGVHSKRWAGEDATDASRNAYLLSRMANVPDGQRGARFVCVACFRFPDGRMVEAEGTVEGSIAHEVRGEHGFGYDPLFRLPEGLHLAELSPQHKNAISHRGRAARLLAPRIVSLWGDADNEKVGEP